MNDYRMNWTLPALPLGPAINPQRIEIDRKAMEAAEFETKRYEINGADQAPRSESVRSDILPATTPEAAPPFKVGDRVTWTVLKGCADGAWNDCVVTSVHPEWTDCCGHRGAVRVLCKVRGVGLFPYYQTELA